VDREGCQGIVARTPTTYGNEGYSGVGFVTTEGHLDDNFPLRQPNRHFSRRQSAGRRTGVHIRS